MAAFPLLADLDLGGRQLLNSKLQLLASDPAGAEALIYWDSTNKRVRVYDGTAWVTLVSGTGYSDEQAQDAVGNILTDSSEIDFTYNDAANTITAALINGSVALARVANQANNTILGNNAGSAGPPLALTAAQAKTVLAIVPGDVTGFDTQVRTNRLDQMAAPTASVGLNSQKITALGNGTATTDGINLGQLQAAIEGRQWKDPVATSTTGALPNSPTYSSGAGTLTAGANAALAAQAGHTLTAGERLLVQNQASTFQNGVYDVTAVGSGAAPWVLTRSVDASTAAELSNATVMVEANDSTLRGKIYTQQNTLADLTAAAQNWTVTGDNNVYTADGTTLQLSGGQFSVLAGGIAGTQLNTSVAGNGLAGGGGSALSVNVDGTTVEIAADTLRVAAGAAGAGLTGGAGSALAVGAGTGISVAADSVAVDTALVVRKFSVDVGDGAATNIAVTHSLGTKDVQVTVRRNSDDKVVIVPWTATSTTVATMNFDTAPTTAQYRVTVQA